MSNIVLCTQHKTCCSSGFMVFKMIMYCGFVGMLYIPDLQCPQFLSTHFSSTNVTSSTQLLTCCTMLYNRYYCIETHNHALTKTFVFDMADTFIESLYLNNFFPNLYYLTLYTRENYKLFV